jgi:hypothetical protein
VTHNDGLLGRAELERAFTALGDRLKRRGVVADLFIVGGAAMALAYDAIRVIRDVDALFVPHGIVLEEAREVAKDLDLPPWWLNEQASVYISGQDDPGATRSGELQVWAEGALIPIAPVRSAPARSAPARSVLEVRRRTSRSKAQPSFRAAHGQAGWKPGRSSLRR